MDINRRQIFDGTETITAVDKKVFDALLRAASGRGRTRSEFLGVGNHEFVPWQIGVTGYEGRAGTPSCSSAGMAKLISAGAGGAILRRSEALCCLGTQARICPAPSRLLGNALRDYLLKFPQAD